MGSRAGNRAWLREWPSLRVMELETTESGWACSKHHRGTTMEHYAGIDVSLESASLCVVDATGRIVREAKVASEPDVLIAWFRGLAAGSWLRGIDQQRPVTEEMSLSVRVGRRAGAEPPA